MDTRPEETVPTPTRILRWVRTVRPEDLLKWATVLTLIALMVTFAVYMVALAWRQS